MKYFAISLMLLPYSYATGALLRDKNFYNSEDLTKKQSSTVTNYNLQVIEKIQNNNDLFFYMTSQLPAFPQIEKHSKNANATLLCKKIIQFADEKDLQCLVGYMSRDYEENSTFRSMLFQAFAAEKKLSGPIIRTLLQGKHYDRKEFLNTPDDLTEAYLDSIILDEESIESILNDNSFFQHTYPCRLSTFAYIIKTIPSMAKATDPYNDTLLHYVAEKVRHIDNLEERIRILKDNGASVSKLNSNNKTALDLYLNRGSTATHETIIKLLTPPSNNNSDNNNNKSSTIYTDFYK